MKKAFINCMLLDGSENMTAQENMTIIEENGTILSVEKNRSAEDCEKVYDLKGKFLMPGLINLHVHLPAGGRPKKKQSDSAKLAKILLSNPVTRAAAMKMCENYAKTELLSGVTTIRTVGGVSNFDTQIRDKINAGNLSGPHILASNMGVSVPGGHMAGSVAYAAQSTEDAVNFVKKVAAEKPDLIKLMITGGVLDAKVKGEPGEMKMSEECIKACCDEAHKLGFKVAAHTESPEGVKAALKNGVDTIEHGAKADPEMIELFKEKNAALVCTISPALPYALFDTEVSHASEMAQFNGRVVMDGIIDCAKQALANGIPVGLGTDTGCPYITHYDMFRELVYFKKYVGVTNAFALHTATMINAQIAGIDTATGSIVPGKCADMLITKENPLKDLKALREPFMVVCGGKVTEEPKIKKMKNVEKELDKFL